jgi:biopolymer transport protein ExbB/biopolymer transport protein TolQ
MMANERVLDVTMRSVDVSKNSMHDRLKRGVNSLATIGSTAPFVGLFGTVIGLVDSFSGIEGERSTVMAHITAGISESLITTALGLLVAIPAVWGYNYLTTQLEMMDIEMDVAASLLRKYLSGIHKAAPQN